MEKKSINKSELFAKNALKAAGIIKYDSEHELLDITLLRDTSDHDLSMMRMVGKSSLDRIIELRTAVNWL